MDIPEIPSSPRFRVTLSVEWGRNGWRSKFKSLHFGAGIRRDIFGSPNKRLERAMSRGVPWVEFGARRPERAQGWKGQHTWEPWEMVFSKLAWEMWRKADADAAAIHREHRKAWNQAASTVPSEGLVRA